MYSLGLQKGNNVYKENLSALNKKEFRLLSCKIRISFFFFWSSRKGVYEIWVLCTLVRILLVISRRTKIKTATVQPETVTENTEFVCSDSEDSLLVCTFFITQTFKDKDLKVFVPKSIPLNKFKLPPPRNTFQNPKILKFIWCKAWRHLHSAFQAEHLINEVYRNTCFSIALLCRSTIRIRLQGKSKIFTLWNKSVTGF